MVLKLTDVGKVLGARRVLDRVNLQVGQGQIAVVLGENGSGKSTLLRVACGVLSADGGEVEIDGISMRCDEVRAKAKVGYVPDATDALPELLVREFVDLVTALKSGAMASAAPPSQASIARVGLSAIWGQSIGSLSFGQRKRMCLLAAMCGDPPLLVLDEPSNGMDPGGAELLAAIIDERRENQSATLLSSNDTAFAARVGGTHYRLTRGTLHPV